MDEKECPKFDRKTIGRPRSETARQAILCAAGRLLARDGFRDITMEEIAATAGVSKATLYRWWPNKTAVLMEMFLETNGPCCAFPETGDLRTDLHCRMRGVAQALSGRMGTIMAGIFAEAQADPGSADFFRTEFLTPHRAEVLAALARAKARGEIRPEVNLETVVDALYGPIYFRLLAGYAPLPSDFADTLVETLLHGILRK